MSVEKRVFIFYFDEGVIITYYFYYYDNKHRNKFLP